MHPRSPVRCGSCTSTRWSTSLACRSTRRGASDVICHTDFGGHNALIDEAGEVVAILDWDFARLAPREHDLWAAFEEPDPLLYLDSYGRDVDLDRAHLEYALLARGLRDATARVATETDREGVDRWGFDRWRRLDRNLALVP